MNILGVSCFYHDSAACLIQDGKIVAAVQEERFTRIKYVAAFPLNAINYCLASGGLTIYDIDYIGFYEKPFLKFSRVLLEHVKAYPFSLQNFLNVIPSWLEDRLLIPLKMEQELGFKDPILFIKHHLSHASAAFFPSGFDEAAVLTGDGVGEWATMTLGRGKGNKIDIFHEMCYPDSLGLLYSAVTTYLGFEALSGEGKVMGMAAYGKPRYLDYFKDIVRVSEDGSFKLDNTFFRFNVGSRMYSSKFIELFGPERQLGAKLEERHYDIAASLQKFIEDTILIILRFLYSKTKIDKLCLSGGLFLNCVLNDKILKDSPFKDVFIQPAAGDGGSAIGVALNIYHSLLDKPIINSLKHVYLGPCFSSVKIANELDNKKIKYKLLKDDDLFVYVAEQIVQNKIVGWFQGKMEFGPRGLGNRSILANPCNPKMKDLLNDKVKKRESFRPYAPAILEEKVDAFFEDARVSPFMLFASLIREDKRSIVPAIVHVDGTARVQTVNKDVNFRFWCLLKEFEKLTNIPLLLNTSFNLRDEPIVFSPQNAIECFLNSSMDVLVMENYVVLKEQNNEV